MKLYFIQGIKPEHLKTWSGKYQRFTLLIKVFLFEISIVSLQTLPGPQIALMFGVQTITFLAVIKSLFYDKIYQHKVLGYTDLLFETTFLSYLGIGIFSKFFGLETLG
jgi:hypothetical protein